MRILAAHNRYQQPGGEDAVYENETQLLEDHGHEVIRFEISNDRVQEYGKLQLARATLWNATSHDEITRLIRAERPDVAHFHNTFPLISPSAYDACRHAGVPVVQTLHNYRLLCPAATFYRAGKPCELCLSRIIKWPSVVHACYRDDRGTTALSAGMLAFHNVRGTYRSKVDRFIALTAFAKQKFVQAGMLPERIVVKGNSVPDRGTGPGGAYALYVGRLTPEKGIATMLTAWREIGRSLTLKIVGDGPLRDAVRGAVSHGTGIEYLGRKSRDEVAHLMQHAAFLVFPSEWYETFGLTIVEAFASGTPVLAARIGAAAELVHDGVTGRLFTAGDAEDLRSTALSLMDTNPEGLRENARSAYEADFTPMHNLERLLRVYETVIDGSAAAR